jgi:hypothetical protein
MARRTPEEARQAAIKEGFTRLRCLIRNQVFRKDLIGLRRLEQQDRQEGYRAFLRKWDLQWFPEELITANDQIPWTVVGYEQVLAAAQREAEADPNPMNRFICRPAVIASDPHEVYIDDLLVPEDRKASDHTPPMGTVVNVLPRLIVDRSCLVFDSPRRIELDRRLHVQGAVRRLPVVMIDPCQHLLPHLFPCVETGLVHIIPFEAAEEGLG